jgi:hypothetical protein
MIDNDPRGGWDENDPAHPYNMSKRGDDQQALHVLREVALGEGPIDFTAPNGRKVTLTSDRDRLSFIAGGLAAFLADE